MGKTPILKRIFGSPVKEAGEAASMVLREVRSIIDEVVTNAEERTELRRRLLELEIKDRDSARRMQETALKQSDTFARRFIYLFALFFTGLALGLWYAILFVDIPAEKENIIYLLAGASSSILTQIIAFFFGSSTGSKAKDELLSNLAKSKGNG